MNRIASLTTQSIPLALPFAILSAGPLVSALIVSALVGGKTAVAALLRKFTIWRVGMLVLVYGVTAAVVILLAGKNLGRKVPAPSQAELESVVAPA